MAEREGRRGPLLWGGCFLIMVLIIWFWAGGVQLPHPLGVKVLRAFGLAELDSPRVLWEYLVGEGDWVLLWGGKGNFFPVSRQEASGKVIALDATGKEVWQRELPGGVRIEARGANWATVEPAAGQVSLFGPDGRLSWQQRWTWPLQDIILSAQGEMAVLLGPLQEEGTNLIEKLVLVNGQGQIQWEYSLRNGTILACRFAPDGDYLVLSELLFQRDELQNRAVVLDRQGQIGGKFFSLREELFTTIAVAAEGEKWFLGGKETLYCLDYSGEKKWQYHFASTLQRIVPEPAQGGVLVLAREKGSSGVGSSLFYLDGRGRLIWEHRFSAPAAEVEVLATDRGILVGDKEGVYGFAYSGEIIWYYPLPRLAGLAAALEGENLLVYGDDGCLTLLELPLGKPVVPPAG